MWELDVPEDAEPIGYRFLVDYFSIKTIPHFRWSYLYRGWDITVHRYDDIHFELHLYPKSYMTDPNPLKQLEFALKYEGMHCSIIKEFFASIEKQEIITYIRNAPTGKYARKMWFLYEFLMDDRLPIEDIKRGSYVELLDSKQYYCGVGKKSPRHRIVDNLLGNVHFSPFVRRSSQLIDFEKKHIKEKVIDTTRRYDPDIIQRAIHYLYTKETMASWKIEREKPDKAQLMQFISLLERNYAETAFSKRFLLLIQKYIVDHRFLLDDYRTFQNYVGEERRFGDMFVHYISPKPEDLTLLMEGLIECAIRMFSSSIDPVIVATVVAFGFVFMHPFWDGNGRVHRFLIHYTLSKMGFTSDGILFPVSSVLLQEYKAYDKALEYFSRPLSECIKDYAINDLGEMTVQQKTKDFYSYIDFTPIAEFLYSCVEKTATFDLEEELHFLTNYDMIRFLLRQVVDMPERQMDLFIKCVQQNNGTLSNRKRQVLFNMLSDEEVASMEEIVRSKKISST